MDAVYGSSDLRTITGLEILERLESHAKSGYHNVTMNAVREVKWTPEDFKFLKGLESIENGIATVTDEERALVLQDAAQWRKHWNYFVRSERGGKHSVPSFLNQVALGRNNRDRWSRIAHSAFGQGNGV